MYDFVFENAQQILNQISSRNDFNKKLAFQMGEYRFKLLGEGTFGVVFKVIYRNDTFIAKIMKNDDDEPRKILKMVKKIKSVKDSKIQKLIEKYLTTVLDVHSESTPQVIIFEYLDGSDLSDYLKSKDEISESEYYFIITKIIMAITLLHNKLRISHRDLKPQNIFYNPKSGRLKLIDFGFSCFLNDTSCFNRYQGTGNFIHPRMNNKKLKNLRGGGMSIRGLKTKKGGSNSVNKMNRIKSNKNNALLRSFPKPRSQDVFSIVIIIFYIYRYIDMDLNEEDLKMEEIIKRFFSPNRYSQNKKEKLTTRLSKKRILFQNLLSIDETKITNPLISTLIGFIKNYWNLEENNFIVKRKDYSKQVLDSLLEISISKLSKKNISLFSKEKKIIGN
jgi:serine/threonine protein kinase